MHIVDSAGNAYRVDRSASSQSTPRVLKFSFGDGYEQRLSDGINTLEQSFSVRFNNRPISEANSLVDFFDSKAAVAPFAFSPPGSASATSVVTFVEAPDIISRVSGDLFTDILGTDWVIVVGSLNNDYGYSIDFTSPNTTSLLYTYNREHISEVTVPVVVYRAVGVICETWNVVYPQEGIASISAVLKRVYEP